MYVFAKENQVMVQGTMEQVAGVNYDKVQQSYDEYMNEWENVQEYYDSKDEFINEWVYLDDNNGRIYWVSLNDAVNGNLLRFC